MESAKQKRNSEADKKEGSKGVYPRTPSMKTLGLVLLVVIGIIGASMLYFAKPWMPEAAPYEPTLYDTLGVSTNATREEIQAAFAQLTATWSKSGNLNCEVCDQKIQLFQDAFNTLSKDRQNYDQSLKIPKRVGTSLRVDNFEREILHTKDLVVVYVYDSQQGEPEHEWYLAHKKRRKYAKFVVIDASETPLGLLKQFRLRSPSLPFTFVYSPLTRKSTIVSFQILLNLSSFRKLYGDAVPVIPWFNVRTYMELSKEHYKLEGIPKAHILELPRTPFTRLSLMRSGMNLHKVMRIGTVDPLDRARLMRYFQIQNKQATCMISNVERTHNDTKHNMAGMAVPEDRMQEIIQRSKRVTAVELSQDNFEFFCSSVDSNCQQQKVCVILLVNNDYSQLDKMYDELSRRMLQSVQHMQTSALDTFCGIQFATLVLDKHPELSRFLRHHGLVTKENRSFLLVSGKTGKFKVERPDNYNQLFANMINFHKTAKEYFIQFNVEFQNLLSSSRELFDDVPLSSLVYSCFLLALVVVCSAGVMIKFVKMRLDQVLQYEAGFVGLVAVIFGLMIYL